MPTSPDALPWMMRLCEADTTTGREDAALPALEAILREIGARVEVDEVAPGRTNVLALWGEPRVMFSTHLDTVPPHIPPRREGARTWGRGTCDAKGQAAAQFAAIARLRAAGETRLAWLGVVGEETDSPGARAALKWRGRFRDLRALINGEPTGNVIASGQRGFLHLKLTCRGRAAHSGTPERGHSAAWPMLDWIREIRELPLATDVDLGPEVWNLGTLRVGAALNVVPDWAQADILVRGVPGSTFASRVLDLGPPEGDVARVHETPPEVFPAIPDFPRAPVPFGSDAPVLRALVPDRTVVLAGPGSIGVAHAPDEHLDDADLESGIDLLTRLARKFL